MSKTIRIYNKPTFYNYIHPYKQVCMGNCSFCKDGKQDYKYKRKRIKQEMKFLIGKWFKYLS